MRKSLAIAAALMFTVLPASVTAAAQNRVKAKGRVVDTEGAALPYATLAVMKADSTVVAGTSTAEDGTYILETPEGSYSICVSMLGYRDNRLEIKLMAPEVDLPDFVLEEDEDVLEAAKVTGKLKLVEMKTDKIVMNVSQSAFASTSNALDLVKKAPGVTVDKDGNIKLNGRTVDVWIDGRPSHMDGKSLEALLRSTNGSSIEKFELMPNPSSKYDASGQGGIINIKTKKTLAAGFNGSLGASGGGMYFKRTGSFIWNEDLWANLNYKGKKTNTFLNLYEGIYNSAMDFSSELEMTTPVGQLKQSSYSLMNSRYAAMNVKLGNDWFINDKDILGFIVNVPGSKDKMGSGKEGAFTGGSVQETAGVRTESRSGTDNRQSNLRTSVNLNYTHIFDEAESSELTANMDWYRTSQVSENEMLTHLIPEDGEVDNIQHTDNNSVVNIYSAKADWQTMFWKNAMLETGAKWSGSFTGNSTLKTQTGSPDSENDYRYTEQIAALYVSLAKPFGTKVNLKAGLRGEYTYSCGDWQSSSSSTKRSYFDLFPTVYLGYNPTPKAMLSISYTRRIQRPGYYSLNPTEQFVDGHTYMRGNPDLKPQYSNSVFFGAVLFQHYSLSLGYNYSRNIFNQAPQYRENGDLLMTWDNFGHSHTAYLSAGISSLPVAKWFDLTLNLNGVYTSSTDGKLKRQMFSFSGYTDLTFNLPADWKIQLDGFYSSPQIWGYIKMGQMWTANFALKKTLLGNKLTLTLSAEDLFRSIGMDLDTSSSDDSVQKSLQQQKFYNQKIKLGILWNFGQAQRTRYRKVGNLDEASRMGGSGGMGVGGK